MTKRETDANYKRMLHEAMKPENLAAVRVGVASHNLFDLAYGLVLATEGKAGDRVQFEMLEGMANHQRRALLEQTRNLLLYAPACRKEGFLNAIGYLIRRLDENTGPENFLRHAFKLRVGSLEWDQLERGFRECFSVSVADAPRRTQNRLSERFDEPREEMKWTEFLNEPDTDWSLPQNSEWAEQIMGRSEAGCSEIPIVIAGECLLDENGKAGRRESERGGSANGTSGSPPFGSCLDPSRAGVVLARYRIATEPDIERAVACAKADPDGWRSLSVDERNSVLGRAAREIRRARADLLWAATANGGKTLAESDPEVSEAVDFRVLPGDGEIFLRTPKQGRRLTCSRRRTAGDAPALGAGQTGRRPWLQAPRCRRRRAALELSHRHSLWWRRRSAGRRKRRHP
jgi:RHH-type proline utilization regulon transcriptional repressor/proline dehydrogenase/delta 1-pyrroline-5-carboxylate dehydrogenase